MNNKLQPADTKQIPPWLFHFLVHVVKRCATILVKWIEEVQEMNKVIDQTESISYNGLHQKK